MDHNGLSPANMMPPFTIRKAAAARGLANRLCTCFWNRTPTSPAGIVPAISRHPSFSSAVPCIRPSIALRKTARMMASQSRQT